jgi:hypothetical protein
VAAEEDVADFLNQPASKFKTDPNKFLQHISAGGICLKIHQDSRKTAASKLHIEFLSSRMYYLFVL